MEGKKGEKEEGEKKEEGGKKNGKKKKGKLSFKEKRQSGSGGVGQLDTHTKTGRRRMRMQTDESTVSEGNVAWIRLERGGEGGEDNEDTENTKGSERGKQLEKKNRYG